MNENIISHFSIEGALVRAGKFGSGLINDTFLAEFREGSAVRKYILQRINPHVFNRPDLVMENVETVTSHIANNLRSRGVADPYTKTPALIYTKEGRSHYRDGSGGYWRMFHFIETGDVFDRVQGPDHAFQIGRGLGMFQSLLSDLDPGKLHDTLPGFHHTGRYLKEFDAALQRDAAGRAASIGAERAVVEKRRPYAGMLTRLLDRGEAPLRAVHNDPKVNNFMLDKGSGEVLCMIDLDTVKAGTVLFDFGDCVRSAANPAGEDGDLSAVGMDRSLFEALARGYLQEAGSFLAEKEIENLVRSVMVITFELGIRFLADYLRGDTYFKVSSPDHNLHRARVQFKLLESIEQAEPQMASLIDSSIRR